MSNSTAKGREEKLREHSTNRSQNKAERVLPSLQACTCPNGPAATCHCGMRPQGRSEDKNKDALENKTDVTENGQGSQWDRASPWCASQLRTHAGTLSSTDPEDRPRARETRTRKWAWAVGGWALGCQRGEGLILLALPSWDGHPTLGASSSPAYTCFKRSPETTTQAPR